MLAGKSGGKRLSNGVKEEVIKKNANQVFKKISPVEFQYRKDHNLCFKCGDKFGPRHNYKNKEVHMLLMDDYEKDDMDEEGMVRKRR